MAPETMYAAASDLHTKGYTVIPVNLWEERGQKRSSFPKSWQTITHVTCLGAFQTFSFNAFAIKTGYESDIIVLDADVAKEKDIKADLLDGVEVVCKKLEEHDEVMDQHIAVKTGNNGRHLFFSLSKSIAAGLSKTNNAAKLFVDGMQTTIDVRGEGGCVFAAPSTYGDKSYEWMSEEVPRTADLPVCPSWMIQILNNQDRRATKSSSVMPAKRKASSSISSVMVIGKDREMIASKKGESEFQENITPMLEEYLHNNITKWYPKEYGGDFHVHIRDIDCAICAFQHDSNAYSAKRLFSAQMVIVRNYSTRCHAQILGWDSVPIIRDLIHNPTSDLVFVQMFVEGMKPNRYVYHDTMAKFLKHDGAIWKVMSDRDMRQEIISFSINLLKHLTMFLWEEMGRKDINIVKKAERVQHKDLYEPWEAFSAAQKYIQKAGAVDNITKMAKDIMHDAKLAEKMDADVNLLGCQNGVLDLRTGQMRPPGEDYVSQQVSCAWMGLKLETPIIDTFFASIFNNDQGVIRFMQKFLGYCITGLTKSQVWAIFCGSGANGKGALNDMMMEMLGPYAAEMHRDCIFKTNRSSAPGAAETHMVALINKRWAVRDESSEDDVLNDTVVKKVTGGGRITARGNYQSMSTFQPTFKPILMTNNRPKIDVTSEAMKRRILIILFPNRYKSQHEFDESDPTHRLRDDDLPAKLSTAEAQQQLLVWCVKGAVRWFENGLGDIPAAILGERERLYEESDDIGTFIKDNCDISTDFSVSTTAFKASLEAAGICKAAPEVKRYMENRNFSYKRGSVNKFLGLQLRLSYRTASASEDMFKKALEARLSIVFVQGSRPDWLQGLELDLFHAASGIAIEYNGPQHYTYPNPYHCTHSEFVKQQQNDVKKSKLCLENKVHLLQIKASNLHQELTEAMEFLHNLPDDIKLHWK